MHNNRIRVVCELIAGEDLVTFCPVRVIRGKKGQNLVCAFCDTAHIYSCRHVSILIHDSKQRNESDGEESEHEDSQRSRHQVVGSDCISRLALSPVNCTNAVLRDMEINKRAMEGRPYTIPAPRICDCGARVSEATKQISEGVIMATIGQCKLLVEEFKCSSKSCSRTVVAEGRSSQVLLLTATTAASHVFLRRELAGVIIGNGTLSSRLSHYYSICMENAASGVIRTEVPPRSLRTLKKLCGEMLRLMTMCPDPKLFTCGVCDVNEMGYFNRVFALCVDGVYQGFKKDSSIKYLELSEPFRPYPGRASTSLTSRPNLSFFRHERAFTTLFKAIKGDRIDCKSKYDARSIAMALRCIQRAVIPEIFATGSVCGTTRNDYNNDIGDDCYLSAISHLTRTLFNKELLIRRLLQPLITFISRLHENSNTTTLEELGALGRAARRMSLSVPRYSGYLRAVLPVLRHASPYVTNDSSVDHGTICWNGTIRKYMSLRKYYHNEGNLREVLNMYRILLQGPLPQFILKENITSIEKIAELCCEVTSGPLQELLQATFSPLTHSTESHIRFLARNRFMQAGLVNILEIERTEVSLEETENGFSKKVRIGFAKLLQMSAKLTLEYYSFYEKNSSSHSSVQFAQKWGTEDLEELSSKMELACLDEGLRLPENSFDKALVTGSFFPSLPQIRPLPFNADTNISSNTAESEDLYGPCGKDYYQRQQTYTPGSIIVSCACSNSISYGVKVMQRDEGPRCVLDTIISRFGKLPQFIIYDFACGLFGSAAHTLWWVLAKTTIVTDNFHCRNHGSCSPSFLPRCHGQLDLVNTVAHEQNNRPVTQLGRSLRNSSYRTYLGLLSYLLLIENIKAKTRATEAFKNRDRRFNEHNMAWGYFLCLEMKCTCCSESNS